MKSLCAAAVLFSAAVGSFGATADYQPARGNYDFPIYTNRPPGKQITANQVPATTPALSPEETRKLIQVPPGFEVRLFAAEPMVVNPVAMTWDERGRLWVVELYEYPKGAPKDEKGRDRIKILEDTDADGVADKVTVFADGYSLATGIALGNGGVYLGQAPHLYFLEDTNGDDKMDKQTILKTGFGMEDRHELLNGFAWGPDGWLYMTHGVFTHSKVRDPQTGDAGHDPDGFGVQMDAALARFHPVTKKFEVFADGTSNPWGVDWNERGDAFVSACVIQHLFHMAPGGQYNRQGGTWANPYGYVGDLPTKGLPAVVDFRHYRAAHAGLCVYQGDQYPAEWRGLVMLGNIHQSALNCDRLTPVGATYKAEKESTLLGPAGESIRKKSGEKIEKGEDWKHVGAGNFLVSRDPWFRPVATHTGPDGAMWVMDWYDKYPCYQNAQADPEGVDRVYGRIWRVVWVGDQPGKAVASRPSRDMDLKKLDAQSLTFLLLENRNSWHWRQALRLLTETRPTKAVEMLTDLRNLYNLSATEEIRQAGSRFVARYGRQPVIGSFGSASESVSFTRTLWAFHGMMPEADLAAWRNSTTQNPVALSWLARFGLENKKAETGYSGEGFSAWKSVEMSASSPSPVVRAGVAVAIRSLVSGSLTAQAPSPKSIPTEAYRPVIYRLLQFDSEMGDTYYPHIVWMAMEPLVASDPSKAINWWFEDWYKNPHTEVRAYCLRRTMRRICDLTDPALRVQHLNTAVEFLGTLASNAPLASAALDGLIEAMKSKNAKPTTDLATIFAKLNSNPVLTEKARRLATLLGDTSASKTLIAKINDARASLDERLKGIQAARETKDEVSRTEVVKLMTTDKTESLLLEGARSLSAFNGDEIAYALTDAWKNYSLPVRRAVADVLVTRSKWARALLAGVENKAVAPQDISATARRALADASDKTIADNAERLLGRYRPPGADKLKLIADKRAVVLSGTADANNGHEVAKRTCFVCHKLYGEGADVGPDLTGVGRSTLEALLHNVIDPNEVVGGGFETTEVTLKDDSTVSGRVVEETDTRIKLVASGPMEHTLAKSDIKVVNGKPAIRKTELSLMPDGLEQIPDKDFRDMMMFILNPPGDKRPWTPALRKELIGEEGASQKAASAK